MTSYFIVIYSCNTIGSQIVIVKDNNIESIHKLLEGQKAIKPMFFREDFSANELNRMRMRKAIRTDFKQTHQSQVWTSEEFPEQVHCIDWKQPISSNFDQGQTM